MITGPSGGSRTLLNPPEASPPSRGNKSHVLSSPLADGEPFWLAVSLLSRSGDRLLPVGEIDDDSITGFDQVLRCDHDLLTPLSRACAEDRFLQETRLEEGTESGRLPAKSGDGADHVSGRLLHDLRIRHFDVPRADRLLEITRDGILVPAQHDQNTLARIHLKDQRLDRLAFGKAQDAGNISGPFFCFRWKAFSFIRDIVLIEIHVGWKFHIY